MKKIALVVFIGAGIVANSLFAATAPSSVNAAAAKHQAVMQTAMAEAGI